jgi:hypothetical protein
MRVWADHAPQVKPPGRHKSLRSRVSLAGRGHGLAETLPEVVGEGGLLFDIPARYTPETRDVPAAEEVEPWAEAILRLWDDEAFYRQQSTKARRQAERW